LIFSAIKILLVINLFCENYNNHQREISPAIKDKIFDLAFREDAEGKILFQGKRQDDFENLTPDFIWMFSNRY